MKTYKYTTGTGITGTITAASLAEATDKLNRQFSISGIESVVEIGEGGAPAEAAGEAAGTHAAPGLADPHGWTEAFARATRRSER